MVVLKLHLTTRAARAGFWDTKPPFLLRPNKSVSHPVNYLITNYNLCLSLSAQPISFVVTTATVAWNRASERPRRSMSSMSNTSDCQFRLLNLRWTVTGVSGEVSPFQSRKCWRRQRCFLFIATLADANSAFCVIFWFFPNDFVENYFVQISSGIYFCRMKIHISCLQLILTRTMAFFRAFQNTLLRVYCPWYRVRTLHYSPLSKRY